MQGWFRPWFEYTLPIWDLPVTVQYNLNPNTLNWRFIIQYVISFIVSVASLETLVNPEQEGAQLFPDCKYI